MSTGQNSSRLLTGEIRRPVQAVVALAEKVVSRSGPDADEASEAGVPRTDDPTISATDEADDHGVEQLISPRERLIGLLEANDGRMKQSEIVGAVEWSESTVSRKLGALESDGAITRYRIGRGKLVFLPGAEPDCLGSPFDGEEAERSIAA